MEEGKGGEKGVIKTGERLAKSGKIRALKRMFCSL